MVLPSNLHITAIGCNEVDETVTWVILPTTGLSDSTSSKSVDTVLRWLIQVSPTPLHKRLYIDQASDQRCSSLAALEAVSFLGQPQ